MATSRARFIKALWAFLMVATLSLGGLTVAFAQDSRIEPSTLGEMPTSGGLRPGPAGAFVQTATPEAKGVIPVAIQIPECLCRRTGREHRYRRWRHAGSDGTVISRYKQSPGLGAVGNILMAGHLDYWDVGPAVLYNVNNLNQGDTISVTGEDGVIYTS
ncbi:MAG: class F sortase [Thermomicrobiales bacterium]